MTDQESSGAEAMNSINDSNAKVVEEFRANHGAVGAAFEGALVLLLHTTGARSGRERVNPMMYLDEGGRIYVFASKGGADTSLDWFDNVVANPTVTFEIGSDTLLGNEVPVVGAERDRIYGVQVGRFPGFGEYQAKTSRVIPVVELVRSA
jgi:deazaflavin-dependent oxidoreductase (nitroreductase family)